MAAGGRARAQAPAFVPPDPAARVTHDASGWTVTDASCPTLPPDASLRQRIVDVALSYRIVDAAAVTVHKPQAPITVPFGDVSVTLRRRRGDAE